VMRLPISFVSRHLMTAVVIRMLAIKCNGSP
jgi:hypothetical protein